MKLYFTDPIKALYMMREFGVKVGFYEPNYDKKTTHKIKDGFITEIGDMFIEYSISELFEVISHSLNEGNDLKDCLMTDLYVKEESESIFLPKEGDYGMWSKLERPMTFRQRSKWKEFNNGGYFSDTAEIIMRDGKCFFTGEIENE